MQVPLIALLLGLALTISLIAADVEKGVQLYKDKDYEQAASVLRSALSEEPENDEAHFYLGVTLLELKQYKDAEHHLDIAVKTRPEARVGLAKTYLAQNRGGDAVRVLAVSAQDQEETAETHRTRGAALLKEEKFKEAAAELKKAIDKDPKDAYAHYYYGMANSRLGRKDLMVKHFQIFVELAPDAPEAERVKALLRSL
jgi:tetratricopeptide (TPR) repeat protein